MFSNPRIHTMNKLTKLVIATIVAVGLAAVSSAAFYISVYSNPGWGNQSDHTSTYVPAGAIAEWGAYASSYDANASVTLGGGGLNVYHTANQPDGYQVTSYGDTVSAYITANGGWSGYASAFATVNW